MSTTATPTRVSPAVVDGVDVDAVATAVRTCRSVAALQGGPPDGTVTYLPGRRVDGVRVSSQAVQVQVRLWWGVTVADAARQIRAATAMVAPGRRVDIIIADLD